MRLKMYFLSIWGLGFSSLAAQQYELYEREQYVLETDTLRYRILYPDSFSNTKQYPLVIVLHGAGERGRDNQAQLVHGGDLFLKPEIREQFPAIVVFPQVEPDDYWAQVEVDRDSIPFEFNFTPGAAPTKSMGLLIAFTETLIGEDFVDDQRVYIGGLSMGGMGTFEILYRKPDLFAAAFAICGGADPSIVRAYPKHFNIWIFHGEEDLVVPVHFSKTMAREINSQGGNAKLSLYPDVSHNSWDAAFSEPFLLPWLFSNSRSRGHSE